MLKIYIHLSILTLFVFVSCKDKKSVEENLFQKDTLTMQAFNKEMDEYRIIDNETISKINQIIIEKKISNPLDILYEYAPKDSLVEDENYSYEVKDINIDGIILLMLIEDGIHDAALKARKILMRIDSNDKQIKILQIKESYKCWEWRGSQEWSPELCQ